MCIRDSYRAQDDVSALSIEMDPLTSIIKVHWKDKSFKVTTTILGARSSIDEAVINVNCTVTDAVKNSSLLLVVRPYNHHKLGSVNSAEYFRETSLVSINGSKKIALNMAPDFILTGSGNEGDVNLKKHEDSFSSSCESGMATIAPGYKIKKGKNEFNFRIAISDERDLLPGKMEFDELKDEYISYAGLRIKNGMNIKIPDKNLQNWFYASKVSLLSFHEDSILSEIEKDVEGGCRSFFHYTCGLNRMGYLPESLKLIKKVIEGVDFNFKKPLFSDIINNCYVLDAIADYFVQTRDIDFLQSHYTVLKNIAASIYGYIKKIKSIDGFTGNSINNNYIKNPHYYDMVLISFSLKQFSYLARCLGIFGDEKKYSSESDRITDIFADHIADYDSQESLINDEFFFHDIYSGYPLHLENLSEGHITKIVDAIYSNFSDLPVNISSLGLDMVSSIIIATNLLLLKDPRALDVMENIMAIGNKGYSLTEFINPVTKRGCWVRVVQESAVLLFFHLSGKCSSLICLKDWIFCPLPCQTGLNQDHP